MKKRNAALVKKMDAKLRAYEANEHPMPGIENLANRICLLQQLVESIRRIEYVHAIRKRYITVARADPRSDLFDPLKAAVLHIQHGDIEEAFWFVFLFVHFGKHLRAGWRLARDVYGGPSKGTPWTWKRVSVAPVAFSKWLEKQKSLWDNDNIRRHFGNHRKYESLKTTGAAVESYVTWVKSHGTHQGLIQKALMDADGDSRRAFEHLYRSMSAVIRFGRMARFDYLTMLGKLGLANIEPGRAYLDGATGPMQGACLLFTGHRNGKVPRTKLEAWLVTLGSYLGVGQQVLEDALCNWQKSPHNFIPFRG